MLFAYHEVSLSAIQFYFANKFNKSASILSPRTETLHYELAYTDTDAWKGLPQDIYAKCACSLRTKCMRNPLLKIWRTVRFLISENCEFHPFHIAPTANTQAMLMWALMILTAHVPFWGIFKWWSSYFVVDIILKIYATFPVGQTKLVLQQPLILVHVKSNAFYGFLSVQSGHSRHWLQLHVTPQFM